MEIEDNHPQQMRLAFAITESDLAQNRSGRLSRHQRWLLKDRLQRVPRLPHEVVVVAAGLVVVGLVTRLQYGAWLGLVLCSGPGLVLIAAALILGRDPIQRLRRDMQQETVLKTEGTVRLKAVGRRPVRYRMMVAEHRFWLPAAIYRHLRDETAYEVYYTPRSMTVVAAVPLE